jgi:hypothetical protein
MQVCAGEVGYCSFIGVKVVLHLDTKYARIGILN